MIFNRKGYDDDQLKSLYTSMLYPRMVEEKMLVLLRQGRISKWFSGIGQEAIAASVGTVLRKDDYVLPLHRNLGVFINRGIPFKKLFSQWQGKPSGFTKGRDRSFHFGTTEYNIIGMISHLGANLPVANGISLGSLLEGKDYISLGFSGDGGASEGDFHEALNVAAVQSLPVIFLVENNGYGLSTPSADQFKCKYFVDKGPGYGIDAIQVDGNNIIEMHRTLSQVAETVRTEKKPFLVEALTFRMRGHEEASGTKYVPKELFDKWGKKDPVNNYEKFLVEEGILTEEKIKEIRKEIKAEIEKGIKEVEAEPEVTVSSEVELSDLFAPSKEEITLPSGEEKELRFVDAIREGLLQSMEKNDDLVIMGQDIAEYGGVFKITDGFVEKFGKQRVRNTPICESAIIGMGLGLSITGKPSVVEMQFADFVSCGFNQIVNNLAKTHYRWGQSVNVTVRMPSGAGVAAGPFHSQSNEGWFCKVPGLKIVYPSNPADAKGLLISAINEPNPVLFFEHKALYRSLSGKVHSAYYNLPLGKAAVAKEGEDLTIVTYGMGVHWALKACEDFPNASIEIVDLRTLLPWDKETVYNSIKKTNKVLLLSEDTATLGFTAEISASISEELFEHLDGPLVRVSSLDTPVPFHAELEKNFLGKNRLNAGVEQLLNY